jgi:DNA adenine methylase
MTATSATSATTTARPFLKWVGGKAKLIPQFAPYIPKEINTYFEPFLGGGAMFFHLQPKQAVLQDINTELINTYKIVRDNVELLIDTLKVMQSNHCKEYYYSIRANCSDHHTRAYQAARFIYLNKTCFNGLHRVNQSGKFNVPMGDYKNPLICDEDNLRACSKALQKTSLLDLKSGTSLLPERCDFVYFDPPYYPLNATSKFTSYSRDGFTEADQVALKDRFSALASKGVAVMLSNSDCEFTRKLYQDFQIIDIQAARSVNCKGGKRGKVGEILVIANCGD